ncbi:glycosyltransferase family 2 protein [Uliginosibacterium sediminicola]|uniref:Glycosyltransferase family 2 protein n=1 Tax=Uliginosibacterium sediminicola TaxID=2024550 RepID=A0ABU9YX46_9RHOO
MNASFQTYLPVSVVIVNYNAGDLLRACVIEALRQAVEVIVVDNASADNSLALLEQALPAEPRLSIVRTGANLGFAKGCNIGLARSTQSRVLFLNPDCVLSPGSLQRLLSVLDASPEVGMVGGLLMYPDGTEQGGGRRAVPTPWRSFVRAFGLVRFAKRWPRLFFDFHLHGQPLPAGPIEVEAISGALMLVRREALDDVGGWDEDYFLHCEDLDWCMRFNRKGWKILFVPDAPVVHQQGACSRSRPYFVEWHKHRGMVRFYRKFFREQYPGVLMWLVEAGVWLRFAVLAGVHSVRKVLGWLGLRRG